MLQLDANTKRPTPRCSAIWASAMLAFSLIASVTALELLAHRVVRDRGEMNDGVDAIEQLGREIPDVAEMQPVQQRFRKPRSRRSDYERRSRCRSRSVRRRESGAQLTDQTGPT